MKRSYAEPAFDGVLVLASLLALAAYMLGVLLDPWPAIGASLALVAVSAWGLVPAPDRVLAAISGSIAVLLAGVAIPRYVASVPGVGDELALVLALSGIVLLLAFAVLRATVFRERSHASPAE